jgi:hypothetical protein
MATQAGFTSFRRTWDNPDAAIVETGYATRASQYAMLVAWYHNAAFDDLGAMGRWQRYRSDYKLYRATRSIYNPVRRLVDFYAGQVYPGVLSEDGSRLPDGVPLAIPLSEDTPLPLKDAIAQWWQWSNWQAGKSVFVRYGACTGDVLVEVVDDVARGKVTGNIVWPGRVVDLTLDAAGNVKGYAIEYRARDDAGRVFLYRKEVDTASFRTFKDDNPFGYDDQDAESANPYGFVPAVWCKHSDFGGDHGGSVVRALGKLDELNSLAAHVHDQIHKKIAAPFVVWANGDVGSLFKRSRAADDIPAPDQDSALYLKGPEGGSLSSLTGDLDLGDALPYMQQLLIEIEHDHPELSMYQQLRGMGQVTGPAAARLVGDVASLVYEAQANYDQASIKLFQMSVAIAGWRVGTGAWGRTLTRQQQKFAPFDLTSYARGELDIAIVPRPIIPETAAERLAMDRTKLAFGMDQQAAQPDAALAARIQAKAGATDGS